MKKVLFTIITLLTIGYTNAQKIETRETFESYEFISSGIVISFDYMQSMMSVNKEAYSYISSANTKRKFGNVLGFTGGFFIGYPLGQLISGKDVQWELALIGTGLITISIPIYKSANSDILQAIDIYNKSIPQKEESDLSLDIQLNGTGAGIVLKF
jgi:hypothetical protein